MSRKSKRGRSRKPTTPPPPPPTDSRALEKTMWEVSRLINTREFDSMEELNAFLEAHVGVDALPAPPPSTPLERAQEIMYQAWGARGRRRTELARQALEVSEDCADAYVLLAEEARSVEEALTLYEQGVQAGERAIGPENYAEWTGRFWGVIETRPYMRARAGLANVLWELNQRREAAAHMQELLRLNPEDNQGIRYMLASCLLELGEDEALEELFDAYGDDPSAEWLYNRALYLFRRHGDSYEAETALGAALKGNAGVVLYLLDVVPLPKRMPEYVGLGDANEAIVYVATNAMAWYETEGAIEWFLRVVQTKLDEELDEGSLWAEGEK